MRVSADKRQDAIREVLHRHLVATQDDLRRHLAARGIRVAQATLSRDMVRLGVRRRTGPDGPRYEIAGDDGGLPLEPVRRLAESVSTNGALVVVRTKSGAASTVARALDEAGLSELLGTLAGDDTIFAAPARAGRGHALARRLRALLGVA